MNRQRCLERTNVRALSPGTRRRAFTLVELLVAMALAVLLLTVAGRIATTSIAACHAAEDVSETLELRAAPWQWIQEDLMWLLPPSVGWPPVSVDGTTRRTLTLHVLAEVSDSPGSLHVARRPARVHYRLAIDTSKSHGGKHGTRLVREVKDLTMPQRPPIQETIAEEVDSLELQVRSNGRWLKKQPEFKDGESGLEALRVRLRWRGDGVTTTRTFVLGDRWQKDD